MINSSISKNSLQVYQRPDPDSAWTTGANPVFTSIQSGDYLCVDVQDQPNDMQYIVTTNSNLHRLTINGPHSGWHMLSTPVQNTTFQQLLHPFWTQGISGSDAPADSSSIYYLRESDQKLLKPSDMSDPMSAGRGYLTYIYNDDNGDGINDGFPKTNALLGSENTSPVDIPVSATDAGSDGIDSLEGWNLVGNPFDVSINVDQFFEAAESVNPDINRNLYIWDPNKDGGGGYRILSEGDGKMIAPFQGFMLRYMSAVNGTISLDKSAVSGSGGTHYKQTNSPEITLKLQHDDLYDQFSVVFDDSSAAGLDSTDAFKLVPLDTGFVKLYGVADQQYPVAVNRMPTLNNKQVDIPVGFATDTSGTFEMSWPVIDNIPDNWSIGLKDLKTGQMINLRTNKYLQFNVAKASRPKRKVNPSSEGRIQLKSIQMDTVRFMLSIAPGKFTAIQDGRELPDKLTLKQNYPNPFNPTTVIKYAVPSKMKVNLSIYDVLGRKVMTLVNAVKAGGRYHATFNASGLTSGIYFYRLKTPEKVMIHKMMLIK